MSIAPRIKWFLDVNRVEYEVVDRERGLPDNDSPAAHQVPDAKLVRGVLLQDEQGYLLPVLGADRQLDLEKLRLDLERNLKPACEEETKSLFFDCQAGQVPVVGSAYGIPMIVDDELLDRGDFFFGGGGRDDLIHMEGGEFLSLVPDAHHARLSVAS